MLFGAKPGLFKPRVALAESLFAFGVIPVVPVGNPFRFAKLLEAPTLPTVPLGVLLRPVGAVAPMPLGTTLVIPIVLVDSPSVVVCALELPLAAGALTLGPPTAPALDTPPPPMQPAPPISISVPRPMVICPSAAVESVDNVNKLQTTKAVRIVASTSPSLGNEGEEAKSLQVPRKIRLAQGLAENSPQRFTRIDDAKWKGANPQDAMLVRIVSS